MGHADVMRRHGVESRQAAIAQELNSISTGAARERSASLLLDRADLLDELVWIAQTRCPSFRIRIASSSRSRGEQPGTQQTH